MNEHRAKPDATPPDMSTLYDFEAQTLDGQSLALSRFRGEVVLVVNTASACGFTPQLAGLQALHEQFEQQGLHVLGFPCNQFGAQEPGDAANIGQFCLRNYGVRFQMMAKVEVNGAGAHPLFVWLRRQAPGFLGSNRIKWNFTKFLLARDGCSVQRFAPMTRPAQLVKAIENALRRS